MCQLYIEVVVVALENVESSSVQDETKQQRQVSPGDGMQLLVQY